MRNKLAESIRMSLKCEDEKAQLDLMRIGLGWVAICVCFELRWSALAAESLPHVNINIDESWRTAFGDVKMFLWRFIELQATSVVVF